MDASGYSILYILIYFLFYAFVAALLSLWIFLLLCKCYRSSPALISAAPPPPPPPPTSSGLNASAIAALPSFKFVAGGEGEGPSSTGKGRSECVVCLGAFEDNETLRLMPGCGHVFHCACVDVWLRDHATCPYCRADVYPTPVGGVVPEVRVMVAPTTTATTQAAVL